MEEIKSTIDANITPNGEQGITGSVLNRVLNDMVDATEGKLAQLDQEWQEIKGSDFTLNPHVEKVVMGEAEVAATLQPDKFYEWGAMPKLTITFAPQDDAKYVGQYIFQFTSPASTPTSLSMPIDIKWVTAPEIKGGYIYQVSVVANLGIITGWKIAEEEE